LPESGQILLDICPKMPKFFMTFARKMFFPQIWGGHNSTPSPAPTNEFMKKKIKLCQPKEDGI